MFSWIQHLVWCHVVNSSIVATDDANAKDWTINNFLMLDRYLFVLLDGFVKPFCVIIFFSPIYLNMHLDSYFEYAFGLIFLSLFFCLKCLNYNVSETTVKQIEDAFKEFTTREDIAIVMISQYVSCFLKSLSF